MEIKKFRVSIYAVAVLCVVLAVVTYYFGNMPSPLCALSLPMEGVAAILRKLSLSSKAGDALAWALYAAICLLPMIYLSLAAVKQRKNIENTEGKTLKHSALKNIRAVTEHSIELTDVILATLSIYMFFIMYHFINPVMLADLFTPTGIENMGDMSDFFSVQKAMLAGGAYSLLIGYIIIKLAESFKTTDIWMQTERILKAGAFLYVAFVCYALPFDLFSGLQGGGLDSKLFVGLMGDILKLIPMICFIGIMESGSLLIHALKESKYGGEAVGAAEMLAKRSRATVTVSVLCNLTQNILQFLFMKETMNASIWLDIPFLPLILAFIGLLTVEHLKESSLLYDDNQMII